MRSEPSVYGQGYAPAMSRPGLYWVGCRQIKPVVYGRHHEFIIRRIPMVPDGVESASMRDTFKQRRNASRNALVF